MNQVLVSQGTVAPVGERRRFAEALSRAIRQRELVSTLWQRIADSKADDIIALAFLSRASDDTDEAIWRCFLAAHFGRPSAHHEQQIKSASELLRGFGDEPLWTWNKVSSRPDALRDWLFKHVDDLQTLAYGNHRKYESQKPQRIWWAIESFVFLARQYGSPTELISVDPNDAVDGFDVLYRRLGTLTRFGRTGRFDLLVLLLDLGFISAQPISCYLRGATGPLRGARKLWGKRPPSELDELAADLSQRLAVSPIVMEDALCNWQK